MGKVEKGSEFHQFYLVFLLSFLLFAGALQSAYSKINFNLN